MECVAVSGVRMYVYAVPSKMFTNSPKTLLDVVQGEDWYPGADEDFQALADMAIGDVTEFGGLSYRRVE
jgi:hypothetical protein